ncbi:MAG TPA: asparagine synthase (glutamine-hydrolyzing) [Candidatus Acidoferrum sp.]|nr:asparagine synthase (glutamine-hydrolyzing) [Candidatus Acidoferrum sp.]
MCGIVGQVALGPDGAVDVETVRTMMRLLAHRGPDGDGEYLAAEGRAMLGHRRLSIIDLQTGGQPIFNENRTVVVVLNGEIYNFKALRRRLETAGHRFTTVSDTEVLVHLYEDEGLGMVAHLRGMFAFLLWDESRGRLFAARDPIGKKPLYYLEHEGRVSLASELSALMAVPRLPRTLDPLALDLYLTHSYIPSPSTVWSAVKKLPAGHTLTVEHGRMTIAQYWTPPDTVQDLSEAEATARLTRTLEESIELRLTSDVPLGCFLSGGVDSSITCALMSRLGRGPVRTFSIGFDRPEYSELAQSRQVARLFKTEHEEFVVKPDAAAALPDIVERFGEPFGDSSALPLWYLAQLARSRVTVALTGDGGDELFAGYLWYGNSARFARLSSQVPSAARTILGRRAVGQLLRASSRKVAKALQLIALDDAQRFAMLRRTLQPTEREQLYGSAFASRLDGAAMRYLDEAYPRTSGDLIQAMAITDIVTYLPEDLLVKMDRMTMAHALEARSPLLDTRLMELALSFPARLKWDAAGGKRIFKAAFAALFPPGFLERPKRGFSLPVDEWFRHELSYHLEVRLGRGAFAESGMVDGPAVRRLLAEHRSGRSRGAVLWNLLMLAEWFERFGGAARWA